ncbi:MAG: ABC transporter permease, partial [Hyphomicrobiaceae bacterium]
MKFKTYFELMQWGPEGWLDEMVFATLMTLSVAITAFLFGVVFGALAARAKMSPSAASRAAADTYTTVLRGVPDLLVLYLFYFGLAAGLAYLAKVLFGYDGFVELPTFLVGTLAIGLVSGAYQAEVFRGAWAAVPHGEIEAARACGMSGWTLVRRVTGPQVLRYAIPGLGNVWQLVLKESALVVVIGLAIKFSEIKIGDFTLLYETRFSDLLRQAQVAAGSTRQPFPFYITCAL